MVRNGFQGHVARASVRCSFEHGLQEVSLIGINLEMQKLPYVESGGKPDQVGPVMNFHEGRGACNFYVIAQM